MAFMLLLVPLGDAMFYACIYYYGDMSDFYLSMSEDIGGDWEANSFLFFYWSKAVSNYWIG